MTDNPKNDKSDKPESKKPEPRKVRFSYSVPDVWTNEHYQSYMTGVLLSPIRDNGLLERFYGAVQLIKDQHVRFDDEEFKALKDMKPDALQKVPMRIMGYLSLEIASKIVDAVTEFFRFDDNEPA